MAAQRSGLPASAQVFISHSSKDAADARALLGVLEQRGHRCWMAPDDIGPGLSWAEQIDIAIRGSDAVVVLLSRNADGSEHVAREVALAVREGIPLLPVRLGPGRVRGSLGFLLSLVQWVDAFPGGLVRHADPVIAALDYLLSGGRASLRVRAPSAPPRFSRGKHLPAQLSGFIGRGTEIEELRELLRYTRLLTLTGPGGVGKTRLALEVAEAEAATFAGGAVFVGLAPLTDPDLVLPTMAAELGIVNTEPTSTLATLREALGDQRILVLLDNFEHLMPAARGISELLLAVPGLHALITSRARLEIAGEREWRVPSLPITAAGDEPVGESVSLFVERARLVNPQFRPDEAALRVIADICERLDGLPLAIELAAARAGILTLEQIQERLDEGLGLLSRGRRDAAERHGTMAAAIEWSHRLLPSDAQRLFAHLAAYRGGFTLDAIDATTATVEPSIDALEALTQLESGSLVVAIDRPYGRRFTMLETIGQFADGMLSNEPAEAEAIRNAHAQHFASLAESGRDGLMGPDRTTWIARLADEHDNVRAALRWTLQRNDRNLATRLAAFSMRFWDEHGHVAEGRDWLRRVLAMSGDVEPRLHGLALHAAGNLASLHGDMVEGERLMRQALALQEEAGLRGDQERTLSNLGMCLWRMGDLAGARDALEASSAIAIEIGDRWSAATSLENLGSMHLIHRDLDAARDATTRALAMLLELGDPLGIAVARFNLGIAAVADGQLAEARSLLAEALAGFRSEDYPRGQSDVDAWLALLELAEGNGRAAAEHARVALEGYIRSGDQVSILEMVEYAARVLAGLDRSVDAASLLGATSAWRAANAVPRSPLDDIPLTTVLDRLRETLGEGAYDTAGREGAGITLPDAATRAVSVLDELLAAAR